MAFWSFRRKKGGQLMTPEVATAGPALSQIIGGDVHVEVGKPRNLQRKARAEKRLRDLAIRKDKLLDNLNNERCTAEFAETQLKQCDYDIKRYEFQLETAIRYLDGEKQ